MNCLKGDTAMVNVGRRQNEDDDDVPIVGADDDSLSHSQVWFSHGAILLLLYGMNL